MYRLERTEVQQCGSVERHESGDVECINVIEEYNERTNEHANEFHRYVCMGFMIFSCLFNNLARSVRLGFLREVQSIKIPKIYGNLEIFSSVF